MATENPDPARSPAVQAMTDLAYRANEEFESTHWWFLGRNAVIRSVLSRFRADLKSCRALDYGCGTGGVTETLTPLFAAVTAYEPSTQGAEAARRRKLDVCSSRDELRRAAGPGFDALVCLDVIEHVEDDAALLKDAFSLLRPGGVGLVTVPAYEWLWGAEDVVSRHLRRYNRRTLATAFARAGLKLEYVSGFNSLLLPVQSALILAERNLAPGQVMRGERTNLKKPGALEQRVGLACLRLEATLLSRFALPWGASLVAVARKDDHDR